MNNNRDIAQYVENQQNILASRRPSWIYTRVIFVQIDLSMILKQYAKNENDPMNMEGLIAPYVEKWMKMAAILN